MTDRKENLSEGAELWHRAHASWRAAIGAPRAPDAMTLAAYLEGNLNEAAAEAVEVWMAADSEALDTVLAARATLAEGDPASATAPELTRVIARAQGAVRGRAGVPADEGAAAGRGVSIFGALGALLGLRPAVWAGAAALLLASVSGFELGRAGAETMAALDATVSQDLRLVMGRNGTDLL